MAMAPTELEVLEVLACAADAITRKDIDKALEYLTRARNMRQEIKDEIAHFTDKYGADNRQDIAESAESYYGVESMFR